MTARDLGPTHRKRGPKSLADLAVVVPDIRMQRPEPPTTLSAIEAEIWREIVAKMRPGWFFGCEHLLVLYCRTLSHERLIARALVRGHRGWQPAPSHAQPPAAGHHDGGEPLGGAIAALAAQYHRSQHAETGVLYAQAVGERRGASGVKSPLKFLESEFDKRVACTRANRISHRGAWARTGDRSPRR